MTTHGYSAYASGCRCDVCREAKREYSRRRRAEGPRATMACGTSAQYDQGCRCEPCCEAKSNKSHDEYRRNRNTYVAARSRRRTGPTPAHVHGTRYGYSAYGCRCDGCRSANRAYKSKQRQASKARAA